MTNSTRLVQPPWGGERMLGSNPISVAFPGNEEPPVVIDMATSAVAYGKVEIARRQQEEIPAGWAVDAGGRNTTSPAGMIDGGRYRHWAASVKRAGIRAIVLPRWWIS